MSKKSILITGATGYLGNLFIKLMLQKYIDNKFNIIALDIREVANDKRLDGVVYYKEDIRSKNLTKILIDHQVEAVVHLAAMVTPPKNATRAFLHDVEVMGTRNVLESCISAKVKRFIVTSSGAAYGYHADNAEWLVESDTVRGNFEFPYSYHKGLVEVLLEEYRKTNPELQQFIFRVGTILGKSTNNQITNLFDKSIQIAVRGAKSPFVFIWDHDVVLILDHALFSAKPGVYNVAGDGALTLREIAAKTEAFYLPFPAWVLKSVLTILNTLGLSRYGGEQVRFLQYRPVLLNKRLKEAFGYIPQKSSEEVFDYFLDHR